MRAVALVVIALSGCSFFAAEGPHPAPGPTRCNLERTPAVTDAIAAVGAAIAAGVSAVERGGKADVIVPIGFAGTFGVSSAYGFVQVGRCRTEHAKRPAWSLEQMPAVM